MFPNLFLSPRFLKETLLYFILPVHILYTAIYCTLLDTLDIISNVSQRWPYQDSPRSVTEAHILKINSPFGEQQVSCIHIILYLQNRCMWLE